MQMKKNISYMCRIFMDYQLMAKIGKFHPLFVALLIQILHLNCVWLQTFLMLTQF